MKEKLTEYISQGKTKKAIHELQRITKEKGETNQEVVLVSARFEHYENEKLLGISAVEQQRTELANINLTILKIIEKSNSKVPYTNFKDTEKSSFTKPSFINKIYKWVIVISVFIGISAGLAEFTGVNLKDLIKLPNETKVETLQLTVLVSDAEGRVVLENEGELVVDFGNDRRTAMIGEKGRTNFGEIPAIFKGSIIRIGFNVKKYKIIDGKNIFKFTGNPINLFVQKIEKSSAIIKIDEKSNDLSILEQQLKLVLEEYNKGQIDVSRYIKKRTAIENEINKLKK